MNQTEYFTEKIETLPEDLQEAILSSGYAKILSDIQREFKLHIDQGQILETLATQLMFGDIDAPEFINGMFNEAHVSSSTAGDILLKIDTLILKKIRAYIEDMEEVRRKDAELERLLKEDDEILQEDESKIYSNFYIDSSEIIRETVQQLIEEGISPDGSNITDEVLAKELGVTVEELMSKVKGGALKEARDWGSTQSFTPAFTTEKEELLKELESPEKSFTSPLFVKKEVHVTPPDHQLQNTHVEIPYVEEIVPEVKEVVEKQVAPVVEVPKQQTPPVSTIKKPAKLTLSIDPYKEPIE